MVSIDEANERLEGRDRPAVIIPRNGSAYLCRDHHIMDNGWIRTEGFESATVKYPPHMVEMIEVADTKRTKNKEEFGREITAEYIQKLNDHDIEVV